MTFGANLRMPDDKWKRLQEANSIDLKRFFSNVDILAVKQYGSRAKAVKALRNDLGVRVHEQTIKRFKDGLFTDSRFMVLNAWCILFGVPLSSMLSEDYSVK